MSIGEDLRRYVGLMSTLFAEVDPPKELHRTRALIRLDSAEDVDDVARESRISRKYLLIWHRCVAAPT